MAESGRLGRNARRFAAERMRHEVTPWRRAALDLLDQDANGFRVEPAQPDRLDVCWQAAHQSTAELSPRRAERLFAHVGHEGRAERHEFGDSCFTSVRR